MPDGYLVTLGDGKLDPGDVVSGPVTTFVTDTSLGAGSATFINATFNGTFFAAGTGGGTYILGTDGNVYFDPNFDPTLLTSFDSASVTTSPAFDTAIFGTSSDDPTLSGTADDDLIYGGPDRDPAGTANDTISAGGGNDTVFAGDGDDSVLGQAGDDLIEGGAGSDTLSGGANNDTIYGDNSAGPDTVEEALNWTDEGGNATDLSGGFTQTTGLIDVTVSFTDDGNNNPTFEIDTQTNYNEAGEPFADNSSLELFGQGDGATSTTTLSFSSATAGTASDEVTDVQFRINDIDFFADNHRDIVEVIALDADGNPVPVTLTPAGGDTVSGNTITADNSLDDPDQAEGSVLVNIAGPVATIQIVYSNALGNTQAINITDVHFSATPIISSDDSILGGSGDDLLFGQDGNDTVRGGSGDDTVAGGDGADSLFGNSGNDSIVSGGGDTSRGGDGDDTFTIDTDLLTGDGITIIGGEGDEGTGDVLDLSGILELGSIVYTNTDDAAGGLSGTATLTDGTLVTFSEIETIICFTEGTAIQTPHGERRIETLKAGDLVLTMDNGPQPIRWVGRKTVSATGKLAPVRFSQGTIGNHRDLLVSPQHRMLCGGYLTQLHFGEPEVLAPAKSLVDEIGVTVAYGGMVTYVHMLFDQHEVVIANGAPSESFFPGKNGLDTLSEPSREELFSVFPELRSHIGAYGPTSRLCLKPNDARVLATV